VSVCGTVERTLKLRRFSWNRALYAPPLRRRKSSLCSDLCVPDLPKTRPHSTNPHPIAGYRYSNPSLHRMCVGHGILTMCPSGAAFAIPLGPTNPQLITIAEETLVFRRAGFSPALWLLVPAFSLPNAPPWVTPLASQQIGTLSYRIHRTNTMHTRSFGMILNPDYLRRKNPR
jgi:hypothetical protein